MTNAPTEKEDAATVATTLGDKIIDGDVAGVPVAFAQVGNGDRTLVPETDTVPPEVKWQREHRHYHDKIWGVLYLLTWLTFLACGFFLVVKAHPRYEFVPVDSANNNNDSNNSTTIELPTTLRVISSHFRDDVATCCANKGTNDEFAFDLCNELNADASLRRRLFQPNQRALQAEENGYDDGYKYDEADDAWMSSTPVRTSKYEIGDGMFDAFLEAPEIPITMTLLALVLALVWAVLLRFFAIPIVYATEIAKIAFLLYFAVRVLVEGAIAAAVVAVLCAVGLAAFDIYTFDKLKFAGKMLRRAAKSLKRNATMFAAFLPIVLLYAIHAFLFVLFYARSFEVVEVKLNRSCRSLTSGGESCQSYCEYESPSYTTGMVFFLSAAYLWSIVLFHTMRLSIIATVVGSSHFHPGQDEEPGILRAIINTCTTSMGTLSVASLVSAIADKLNRMLLSETLWANCWNPVFWVLFPLYFVCGVCLKTVIVMLTKFSVILHVFTGKSWIGSSKKVFKILKRHFKGGFVTEYASAGVLGFGSYVFSVAIYFIAWAWLDREFETDTFIGASDDFLLIIAWLFFALFNIWYPVLGIYLLILLNSLLTVVAASDPAYWVTPMAATFIACISMMWFTYLSGIFLDTVDVLFLCFAIDKDNCVDQSSDEFAKLVVEGVPTVIATPSLEGANASNGDEEALTPTLATSGMEPIPPPTAN